MNDYVVYFTIIFTISVIVFSLFINRFLLRFSHNLGTRNKTDIIRWGSTAKPSLGGISFFIVFLLSVSFFSIFFGNEQISNNLSSIGILIATTVGFMMGLADDAYNTKPWLKFSTQVVCGIILIISGTIIQISPNVYINYFLTIIWVVGMMNSINMLDNMDAITSSVAAFIILMIMVVLIYNNHLLNLNYVILIGVLGAIIGFLKFNWHPSKMYMGDTGSQFLGVFLAAYAIHYIWNFSKGEIIFVNQSRQIVLIVLIFLIPLADTTTVTINRLAKGKSPFVGGKDHTTHHLSYLGFSDKQIAMLFVFINTVSSFLVYIIVFVIKDWSHFYTFIFLLYALIVFLLLYLNTRISKPSDKIKRARKKITENKQKNN